MEERKYRRNLEILLGISQGTGSTGKFHLKGSPSIRNRETSVMVPTFLLMLVLFVPGQSVDQIPACDSPIYCTGNLLDTVQKANLYKDSKTFVDMNLKDDPATVLRRFNTLLKSRTPSKEQIETFVKNSFDGPGTEFETWNPQDYVENPAFLQGVKDANLKEFGKALCGIWKVLGRKIKQDVKTHSDRYSLLYVPHPFIVPGGRFREAYYWDSYWVVEGLLRCEMKDTVKGMLRNFLSVVEKPESYREDIETAFGLDSDAAARLYSNLASAAESGWDFSSRWFLRQQGSPMTLNMTRTKDIIPIDLNSIMCMNERLLAHFHHLTGNTAKAKTFHQTFENRKSAIKYVLWNDGIGAWQDVYQPAQSYRNYFFPSNLFPWFTGCFGDTEHDASWYERKVLDYIKSQKVLDYAGGIPTSLTKTGQQWDFPNVWPPIEHTTIVALASGSLKESRDAAKDLAQEWVFSNWKGWKRTKNMFEKYDVNNVGGRGGGGEYDLQTGFGWSNGVVLDLLHRYGDSLTSTDSTPSHATMLEVRILAIFAVVLIHFMLMS